MPKMKTKSGARSGSASSGYRQARSGVQATSHQEEHQPQARPARRGQRARVRMVHRQDAAFAGFELMTTRRTHMLASTWVTAHAATRRSRPGQGLRGRRKNVFRIANRR